MPHPAPNPMRKPEEPARPAPATPESPPPSSPDVTTAPPNPVDRGALFRALLDAGCDPAMAYTAEHQQDSMAAESAATQIQPLVAAMHQVTENMATKADLADFATKADLADFATKADLADFATKADLANFATKADLAHVETRIIKWTFGAMMVQTALIVTLIKLLG